MRVLQVNKFLYPRGGDAICALQTGRLLQERGHEVAFWGMQDARNGEFEFAETFMPAVDLNAAMGWQDKFRAAGTLLYSAEARRRVKSVVLRFKPDIVHLHNIAHQLSPSIIDTFKQYRIPMVMTLHDYKLVCASYKLLAHGKPCTRCAGGRYLQCAVQACVKESRSKSLLNTLEMVLHHGMWDIYNRVHTFITPSRFMMDMMRQMGFKKRMRQLPNFVEMANADPQPPAESGPLVYVGRLIQEKGVATLLEAAQGLPQFSFVIIGDGPERDRLETKCRELQLRNVRFTGFLGQADIAEQLQRAACVLAPSLWYENHPLAIIEAFAAGKPVIGARIGGIPELVQDGVTGRTFVPGDAQDLARVIEESLKDSAQLADWGANASKRVSEEFSADAHYLRLMAIYEEALR